MKETLSFLFILFVSFNSSSEQLTVGRTYDIAEPNALTEIKSKAKKITPEDIKNKYKKGFNQWLMQYRVTNLPRATKTNTRFHIPWGVNPKDIYDQHGNIMYPKGFKFNPIKYLKIKERFYVVDIEDLDWLSEQLKPSDKVMINNGDITEAKKKLDRAVFILDQISVEKLGIRVVPSLIKQSGDQFKIKEFKL